MGRSRPNPPKRGLHRASNGIWAEELKCLFLCLCLCLCFCLCLCIFSLSLSLSQESKGCPQEEQISLVCQERGVGFSQSAIVSGNKLCVHTFGKKTNRLESNFSTCHFTKCYNPLASRLSGNL